MRIFRCVGYQDHECRQTILSLLGNSKRCVKCQVQCDRLRSKDWNRRNIEYVSVWSHYRHILNLDGKGGTNYKDMPFYDGWNPKKGGSIRVGADWIITNLGKRPEGCTMHIVDHEKGFVPGNLEWTHPRKQDHQQMFKIIAQQRHRIKELEAEAVLLKSEIEARKQHAEKAGLGFILPDIK